MGTSILLIGLILIYGFTAVKYIPERLHIITNSLASLLAIGLGLWRGLDFEAMGLSLHLVPRGIITALSSSLVICVVAALILLLAPVRRIVTLPQITRPGKIAYETAIRIPLSTALSEEILFRGVLLAVLGQSNTIFVSIIVCSIVFGIWHVLPSSRDHSKSSVLPIVLATTVAGMFFCWLQILAHTIIAPWLVHWTINAVALLTMHLMHRRMSSLTRP